MLELKSWAANQSTGDKPWLILGKGPTFSRIKDVELDKYNTFSLNHVVREVKVDVAHIIDIDVVEPCLQHLTKNCKWLIMPRKPHVLGFPPELLHLEDWLGVFPQLKELDDQGRLICYDLRIGDVVNTNSDYVQAKHFSSEAALQIVAQLGGTIVRSIGIDGGTKYSKSFHDLSDKTKLVYGQQSFDLQFAELEKLARAHNLDYKRLFATEAGANSKPAKATAEEEKRPSVAAIRDETLTKISRPAILNDERVIELTACITDSQGTTSTRMQRLEKEIRDLREALTDSLHELERVTFHYGVTFDRLTVTKNSIEEYKARVAQLETEMHRVYKSPTWKLGRAITKPVDLLKGNGK